MVTKFLSKIIRNLTLFIIELFDFFHKKKIILFFKKKKIKEFSLVFDVGAHKGETINLILKNFKTKKIISFEASGINYKKFKVNAIKLRKKLQQNRNSYREYSLGL